MKTKKKILAVVASLFGTISMFAQTSLIATLSHGTSIFTFYGYNAFVDAYNEAEEGDCITLSSGEFEGCMIEKALTIRGAGMDNSVETAATQLNLNRDSKSIAIKPESKKRLSFENIFIYSGSTSLTSGHLRINGTSTGVEFIKCRFEGFGILGGIVWFTHCKFNAPFTTNQKTDEDAYFFRNSIIGYEHFHVNYSDYDGALGCHYLNCVIISLCSGSSDRYPELKNCIFIQPNSIPANTYHCVALSDVGTSKTYEDLFGDLKNSTNKVASTAEVFKAYTGGVSPSMDQDQYVLTDEAKTKFLGDDGTQVGIYGGSNPFTTIPSNPRIMNFSVLTNNEDGTLKVKLNVK